MLEADPALSPNFRAIEIDTLVGYGWRKFPAYEMDRKGFTMTFGFTGEKAIKFMSRYIDAFNSSTIRVVTIQGEPWFVATDVCKVLGLRPHPKNGCSHHLRKLADDQVIPVSDTGITINHRGMSNAKLISESGLYRLVLRSDKPEAQKFQDWVTRDVLRPLARKVVTSRAKRRSPRARM